MCVARSRNLCIIPHPPPNRKLGFVHTECLMEVGMVCDAEHFQLAQVSGAHHQSPSSHNGSFSSSGPGDLHSNE